METKGRPGFHRPAIVYMRASRVIDRGAFIQLDFCFYDNYHKIAIHNKEQGKVYCVLDIPPDATRKIFELLHGTKSS